jgi:hypothetical protein
LADKLKTYLVDLKVLQAHLKATRADTQTEAFKRACKEKAQYILIKKVGYILTINKSLAIINRTSFGT